MRVGHVIYDVKLYAPVYYKNCGQTVTDLHSMERYLVIGQGVVGVYCSLALVPSLIDSVCKGIP